MSRQILAFFAVFSLAACGAGRPQPPGTLARLAAEQRTAAMLEGASGETADLDVLLREVSISFDRQGHARVTKRQRIKVLNEAGVQQMAMLSAGWAPWYQSRPQIEVTVTGNDGRRHRLDPATIAELPMRQLHPELLSNRRVLRAPLPNVTPGALVDYAVRYAQRPVLGGPGDLHREVLALAIPTRRVRLTIEAPAALPLRHVVGGLDLAPAVDETRDGKRRLVFEAGPFTREPVLEPLLPDNVVRWPYLALSTHRSWAEVAKRYARIVEEKIAGARLEPLVRRALSTAKGQSLTRAQKVARLLALLQQRVRYTGVEFDEAAVVPREPAVTLERGYGDCKDKSALLVALLRAAGISAHVALLNVAPDEATLIELPGVWAFDHAIVYVPGPTPLWVDPAAPHARVNELPPPDQGRLALVAAPATERLIVTPSAAAGQNTYLEQREVRLARAGGARVVETVRARGAIEQRIRGQVKFQPDRFREALESYVKQAYLAPELSSWHHAPPDDLSQPFSYRLEARAARRGFTDDEEAGVALDRSELFSHLPGPLAPTEGGGERARKQPLQLLEPYQAELRYRIVPPPGYVVRALPKSETRRLGPATLVTDFRREKNSQVVVAHFRFSTGDRRIWSPAEVTALQRRRHELLRQPIAIFFDHRGRLALKQGKLRRSLAVYRELIRRHPREVLYRCQQAEALLSAGFGSEARRAARAAVAAAPTMARAYRTLGWVLEHDAFGQRFGPGFDHAGALAAYRRGKALDARDLSTRGHLAQLLEHDAKGVRYAAGADLAAALTEYEAIRRELKNQELVESELQALLRAERFAELKTLITRQLPPPQNPLAREALLVTAIAASDGSRAALQHLAERSLPERQRILGTAWLELLKLRRYPRAVELLTLVSSKLDTTSELDRQLTNLRRLRRLDAVERQLRGDSPDNFVRRFFVAVIRDQLDEKSLRRWFARALLQGAPREDQILLLGMLRRLRTVLLDQGMATDAIIDIVLSTLRTTVDGNPRDGYRVVLRMQTDDATANREVYYLVREAGQYRLRASGHDLTSLGEQALALLQRGRVAAARRWLDWARAEITAGRDGPPFAYLWPAEGATTARVELAAAALAAAGPRPQRAIQILQRARDGLDQATAFQLDRALVPALIKTERHAELLALGQRLLAADPASDDGFMARAQALRRLKRPAELRRLARARLAKNRDDELALGVLGDPSAHGGRIAPAIAVLRGRIQRGDSPSWVYNNLAWYALFRRPFDKRAVDLALKGVKKSEESDPGALNTLAAVYAEAGDLLAARQALLKSRALPFASKEQGSANWYVFGRIAEQAGLTDVAVDAYRKVQPPEQPTPTATQILARQRLKALRR